LNFLLFLPTSHANNIRLNEEIGWILRVSGAPRYRPSERILRRISKAYAPHSPVAFGGETIIKWGQLCIPSISSSRLRSRNVRKRIRAVLSRARRYKDYLAHDARLARRSSTTYERSREFRRAALLRKIAGKRERIRAEIPLSWLRVQRSPGIGSDERTGCAHEQNPRRPGITIPMQLSCNQCLAADTPQSAGKSMAMAASVSQAASILHTISCFIGIRHQ